MKKYTFKANCFAGGGYEFEVYSSSIDDAWQGAITQATSIGILQEMKSIELEEIECQKNQNTKSSGTART